MSGVVNAGCEHQNHRMQGIHGVGEPGLGGLVGLEFEPEFLELAPLRLREQGEQTLCSGLLPRLDVREIALVHPVVAGIDFDKVMDGQELDDMMNVGAVRGMIGECQRLQDHVPAVLRRAFPSGTAGQLIEPDDFLQLVGFQQKGDLTLKRIGHSDFTHRLAEPVDAFGKSVNQRIGGKAVSDGHFPDEGCLGDEGGDIVHGQIVAGIDAKAAFAGG